jgi:hypothetical protein
MGLSLYQKGSRKRRGPKQGDRMWTASDVWDFWKMFDRNGKRAKNQKTTSWSFVIYYLIIMMNKKLTNHLEDEQEVDLDEREAHL